MSKKKNRLLTIVKATAAIGGAAFAVLGVVAKAKKGSSVYDDDPAQKNLVEGKRVIFVRSDRDPLNADGECGHLEAVGIAKPAHGTYVTHVKRLIDVVLSGGALIALSPVFLAISLAIVIDDPGPVLFTQKRVGKNKQYFKLHKFRSMKMCTPHDVPTHMLENPEQYITKVGRFLRAHSLDELPQIWDIFIGNMSIIGPRPGLWNQDVLTAERDKYGANDVMPGLTGLAQINGRDELLIPDKAALDGKYAKTVSAKTDAAIFLKSLGVFSGDDSVVEGGTGNIKKTGRSFTDGKAAEELTGQIGFQRPVTVDKSRMKKILVTGKGSYIGESFAEYAGEHYGDCLDIDTMDMLDGSWKEKDFSGYDAVYHVAGLAHADVGNVSEETKEKYYKVNTDLAVEVCRKAKEDGVKRFIFMSSMIVYGESAPLGSPRMIGKNAVPAPANFYGDSKLQADVAVRALADENFQVFVLRPPMIYGKGSKGNYPQLAKLAKMLPVFPKVLNLRSMLYIDNLCEFLCQLMLCDGEDPSVVLIPQNGEWTPTSKMVQLIALAGGKNMHMSRALKPAVHLAGRMPGKIGGLANKAFGNMAYEMDMSEYPGLSYQKVSLAESIRKTEGEPASPSGKQDVTVVILTKNEEVNLPDCLRSVKDFAERVVVVDSGSSDRTCEIAESFGADVYEHPFENYARQFNWALDNAGIRTKWTFRLDADERLTPALCRELASLMKEHDKDDVNGITMEAWLYFMGKKIRHGCHNKRKLMLFKTGKGRIEDRKMDEHTILSEGTSVYAKERFIHYDFKDMTHWTGKMNWYATREMQDYYEFKDGKSADVKEEDKAISSQRQKKFGVYYRFPMFLRSQLLFFYYYFAKKGFLDGKEGFVYHYMYHCWYRTLVDAKILEQSITGKPFEETGDLKG